MKGKTYRTYKGKNSVHKGGLSIGGNILRAKTPPWEGNLFLWDYSSKPLSLTSVFEPSLHSSSILT